MTSKTNLIVDGTSLDLAHLQELQQRLALFTPGEALFWDDPDISEQMLAAHLDPKSDAARATASSLRPHPATGSGTTGGGLIM